MSDFKIDHSSDSVLSGLKPFYDYIIIGSGFGGSVSALRLAEKGYSVLVIEKGKNYGNTDFPVTNWNLRKWFWVPEIKMFGIQKLTFFRHITILSGVGVGGGSLVYANTFYHLTIYFPTPISSSKNPAFPTFSVMNNT